MKHCNNCNTDKEDSKFHKRKSSIDGLAAKCKCCQSTYDKARANNPDRVLARINYAKTEAGIESMDRSRKKWTANNRGKIYERTKLYRENNPKKYTAHAKVAYEIKCGNLTRRPCEVCKKEPTHAHHDDYDKPLDIRWLCSAHHSEWHVKNGEGLNAF